MDVKIVCMSVWTGSSFRFDKNWSIYWHTFVHMLSDSHGTFHWGNFISYAGVYLGWIFFLCWNSSGLKHKEKKNPQGLC